MDVILIDHARDPLEKLYGAYRTCYTKHTPREVWEKLRDDQAADKHRDVRAFVQERLKTGHVSPLEQVVFWFGISGVSRALSHQLVRHRIGISFEQQSQRYCKYNAEELEYVTPKTIQGDPDARRDFDEIMQSVAMAYDRLIKRGIPAEDARFVLPNATPTNFQIMVNYAELLHIADLRLCHRAQWEFRQLVAKMRLEVKKVSPELAANLQPKCGESRLGYCDEDRKAYDECPLSKVRPHKDHLKLIRLGKHIDEDYYKEQP